MATILSESYPKDPRTQYNFIEEHFVGFRSDTMPMNFRKLVQLQLSQRMISETLPLGDNRSRHIKALMAGTVGTVFTLAARVVRIVVFTLFLLPAIPLRFATATRLGINGAVPELLKKWRDELVDAGIALYSCPVCIINAIHPGSCAHNVDRIRGYYLARVDRRVVFSRMENEAKQRYDKQVAASSHYVEEAPRT